MGKILAKSSQRTTQKKRNLAETKKQVSKGQSIFQSRRRKYINPFFVNGSEIEFTPGLRLEVYSKTRLKLHLKAIKNPFSINGAPLQGKSQLFFTFEKNRNKLLLKYMDPYDKILYLKAQENLSAKMSY